MAVKALISTLEEEILDPEEETFFLFSHEIPSSNLGFIDPKATELSLTLAGRDFTIHQSPTVLSSTRAGGTTGAVLWKITPLFATYLSSPSSPFSPIFRPTSAVLELGCGISPLTALLLAPRVARYVLTDQPYVSRMIHQNLEANPLPSSSSSSKSSSRRKKTGGGASSSSPSSSSTPGVIAFQSLDWELDTPDPSLTGSPTIRSFDAIVCCDCIYNEALVAPLVSATADLARLRLREREDRAEARDSANNNALLQDHHSSAFSSSSSPSSDADRSEPCVCIVAQQLRSPDVFEEWARAFHRDFRVWRVPDALLPEGLRIDSGFVVHVGILREAETDF
ncbi:Putative lysine methyltransferase, S-adenosyl-L-methionine-dependent methyltransferase superfamily [Colletotrichum destructivum]|uniref:Lysine methyltransferase, S-adenosyl-L-methionine-dependent methyltransferase superfamily n=1 Tax=Colletotrichum destructivum TaxID=34406 RepID=A0AAX4IJZ4_9PEZI|nr:Putative lysine methyltransferase, S-adenosyl-L-methionine-dependent methyltransferase superfamily [Colletotrichum destructivum]